MARVARAWAELMARLGYERYGAHGNDSGSMISPELGRHDPERVVGVHVTQLFSFPSGDPAEFADLSDEDAAALQFLEDFTASGGLAYNAYQSAQPQTLAYALQDSPAGWLAWVTQLFQHWVDRDYILSNAAIYWLTGTIGSSMRYYHAEAPRPGRPSRRRRRPAWRSSPRTSSRSAGSPIATTPTSSTGAATTAAATSRRTTRRRSWSATSGSSSERCADGRSRPSVAEMAGVSDVAGGRRAYTFRHDDLHRTRASRGCGRASARGSMTRSWRSPSAAGWRRSGASCSPAPAAGCWSSAPAPD